MTPSSRSGRSGPGQFGHSGPDQPHGIGLLGAGAVGSVLARELLAAGFAVRVWTRDPSAASELLQSLRAELGEACAKAEACTELSELSGCEALVFCVPERAIAALAARAATELESVPQVVLHTSGVEGLEVLAPLVEGGSVAGSLHPLLPLPPRVRSKPGCLRNAWISTSGGERASRFASLLVESLGAFELPLAGDANRAAYHAAAVLLSNGTVALLDAALAVFERAGLDASDRGRDALYQLLARTVQNLETRAPGDALSGPVRRGDVDTIARHLEALRAQDAHHAHDSGSPAELYRHLSARLVDLVAGLDDESRSRMRALLADDGG